MTQSEWLGDYYEEQYNACEWLLSIHNGILVAEAGTGKTVIIANVINQYEPSTVLIICKLANKISTWKKTLQKLLPHYFVTENIGPYILSKKDKILLVHFECAKKYEKRLRRLKFDLGVVDESHKIKNPTSKNSKSIGRLSPICGKRIAMSGTPIEHSEIDFWSQFRFVEPSICGGSWSEFKENQCKRAGFMGKFNKVRPDSKFFSEMKRLTYYMGDEFLGLEPINIENHTIKLKPKESQFYQEMEEQYVLELRDTVITASIKLSVIAKLQQICCGYIKYEDKVYRTGNTKLFYTLDLVETLPLPLVIFCKYRYDVDILCKYLKDDYIIDKLDGRTKSAYKPKVQEKFQNGELDILICEIRTGGTGIDLYAASDAIAYSYRHSRIEWHQLVRRLQRHGQERQVTIHRLICTTGENGTVESDIVDCINSKNGTSDDIIEKIKKRVDMRE